MRRNGDWKSSFLLEKIWLTVSAPMQILTHFLHIFIYSSAADAGGGDGEVGWSHYFWRSALPVKRLIFTMFLPCQQHQQQ